MAETIRVRGLKELTRDFKRISKDLDRKLVDGLKEAADPVKQDAQSLALSRIRNMPASPRWATMRIGVSRAQGLVYIVPAARRRRGRRGGGRPNLADLLFERAMDPAVEQNENDVIERIDGLLGRIGDGYGF